MIYIFSAFYAEAKNIIDHYGLKKEKSPEMVRFDVFANESIRLVITGVGEINAAAAVSNIGGAYGISQDDEILNVGCGAGFSSDICLGSIFLGNKLTEQMTGRTFYPDMLMKANFRECEIVTVANAAVRWQTESPCRRPGRAPACRRNPLPERARATLSECARACPMLRSSRSRGKSAS